jgi:hypothetical protein
MASAVACAIRRTVQCANKAIKMMIGMGTPNSNSKSERMTDSPE